MKMSVERCGNYFDRARPNEVLGEKPDPVSFCPPLLSLD